MAVSGIGASDIISATVGGATFGTALLWALVLGAFFKFVLTEGLARWQLATGTTVLQGWAKYLPRWVLRLFFVYLTLWAIAVSGALISGCGLAVENLTHGAIPFSVAAIGHAVAAFIFIYSARSEWFTLVMKPLIAVMFLSVVACAVMTFPAPLAVIKGLVWPAIPVNGGAYVFSLIGGIGGSLTLLTYNYLLRDEGRVNPDNLRQVRLDLVLAYIFTAVFGLSVMLIAARAFHAAGIAITDSEAVSRMASQLSRITGPSGFYIYSIGFWAAVLASLVGVWQTVPFIFADCWSLLRRPSQEGAPDTNSPRVRSLALAFMALVSIPFAFVQRPLLMVIAFTILGSLFIPFLAATLLYLNNRVRWPSPVAHNNVPTNIVLGSVLLLFLVLGAIESQRIF